MKRTTENLALALQNMGVDAEHYHTGGGCMCVRVFVQDGKYFYIADSVPDEVYEYRDKDDPNQPGSWGVMKSLWAKYEGGFDLNATDGDHILSGVLPGMQNIYALPEAEDIAKEYVKMFRHFGVEPRRISADMDSALGNFIRAGFYLADVWDDWVVAPHRYPPYLPEFSEFLSDFSAFVRGENLVDRLYPNR